MVEEKTLESNDKTAEHPAKPVSLNDSVEETVALSFTDGEVATSSGLALQEPPVEHAAVLNAATEEKKLQAQETITGKMIDKEIANETLERRSDSDAENVTNTLPDSNLTDLEKPDDHSSLKPSSTEQSTRDQDPYSQMAKYIVQDVFERIGCYESLIRRASWANEQGSGDLGTMIMAFSFTDLYEKVPNNN